MSERELEVRTCGLTLLHPGQCCTKGCEDDAVSAVLDTDLTEHTRCTSHDHGGDVQARKPLVWSEIWGPTQ